MNATILAEKIIRAKKRTEAEHAWISENFSEIAEALKDKGKDDSFIQEIAEAYDQ